MPSCVIVKAQGFSSRAEKQICEFGYLFWMKHEVIDL
jgi:hypothetical protein